MRQAFSFRVALGVILSMSIPSVALADGPPAGGFQKQEATQAYTAPLYQTTQPSYVPQSVALSGPRQLPYHEGEAVPAGYTPVERTRRGAVIAGAVVFGSLYLLSTMAAAASSDNHGSSSSSLGALWVPGVGPFIQMASTREATGKYLLAIDGLGQLAGGALFVYGLSSPKIVLVRNDLTAVKAKPKVRPVPMAMGRGAGVGLLGTF